MSGGHRILVVSHGHPDFSLGGGELAAYRLHQAYRQHPQVDNSWFLARTGEKNWPTGALSLRREGEYLWEQGVHDWHQMRAVHRESLFGAFTDLLKGLQPTILHAHHYAHLGLEYLLVARRLLPQAQIWLTLHEFMAICRHNGQMVKTGSLQLCREATPEDCHRCFPESSAEDFWLRRQFFLDRFSVVDGFIAPSEFLRQRYISWGIPAERIVVIENGQAVEPMLPPRPLPEPGARRNRFAFFGQINPYKGLDLLLRALSLLSKSEQRELVLEIHGAHFEAQPQALQDSISGLLAPLVERGTVQWVGPYRPEQMRQRLSGVDWTIVPSIWWENSPLVIQESFMAGRPVICSDIGGMAEKVRHGVDGVHVPVGNAHAWARTLLSLARGDTSWDALRSGIQPPFGLAPCAQAHLSAITAPRQPCIDQPEGVP
jgi:glycosyltransferase involved in cell wall biosynthesis